MRAHMPLTATPFISSQCTVGRAADAKGREIGVHEGGNRLHLVSDGRVTLS